VKSGVRSDRKVLSIIIGAVIFIAVVFCIPCFVQGNEKQGIVDKIEESDKKSSVVKHPRVLFLSSYAYDWESVPKQLEGITDVLNGKTQVDYIFMDTKKMDFATVEDQIYKHIEYNIQKDGVYNVVILGDDAALDFALKYQDTIFSQTPLVFEGINTEEKAKEAAKDPLITGVVEQFPIEDTIRVAKNLCPRATNIVGISDNTESGIGSTKQFYDSATEFPEMKFSDLNTSKMTEKEIEEQIASYGEDTILLFLLFSDDGEGNRYSLLEAIELVTRCAQVPVFKADEIGVGYGLLGGTTISYEEMSGTAAQMALDII